MFCSQILFSSATVAFRTNFLSLADFKSDLSWTNLKLSSSATWPLAEFVKSGLERFQPGTGKHLEGGGECS